VFIFTALLFSGCGTVHRHGLDPRRAAAIEKATVARQQRLSNELEERILALDPGHVTGQDIHETLSRAPAPQIINIHGGLTKVIPMMVSFSEFLAGMGYPLKHHQRGRWTYSFQLPGGSE
jgi:hypothetical protein